MTPTPPASPSGGRRPRLSEDWLATIIGLLIVAAIGLGLIGPGPQTASLKAAPGESAAVYVKTASGWKVSATLGGDSLTPNDAPTTLTRTTYFFVCQDGQIAPQPLGPGLTLPDPPPGEAQLVFTNNCDQDAALSYKTDYVIPWPAFGLFKR